MKTVIHIKTDVEVKENAQEAASVLGVTLSDVVNASLRNFIRTRKVIFSDTPIMTMELENILSKVDVDIKNRKNLQGPFSISSDMDEYLDSL